jgi:hypothetical protein
MKMKITELNLEAMGFIPSQASVVYKLFQEIKELRLEIKVLKDALTAEQSLRVDYNNLSKDSFLTP